MSCHFLMAYSQSHPIWCCLHILLTNSFVDTTAGSMGHIIWTECIYWGLLRHNGAINMVCIEPPIIIIHYLAINRLTRYKSLSENRHSRSLCCGDQGYWYNNCALGVRSCWKTCSTLLWWFTSVPQQAQGHWIQLVSPHHVALDIVISWKWAMSISTS